MSVLTYWEENIPLGEQVNCISYSKTEVNKKGF